MTAATLPDRKNVRKFFAFDLNSDDLKPRPVPMRALGIAALIALLVASAVTNEMTVSLTLGLLGGIGLEVLLVRLDVEKRRKTKHDNHADHSRLAADVRAIQASDTMKAFLRVFERTMIDPATLRRLDQVYSFEEERRLFDEDTLRERLADLQDKSIRMISQGDFSNKAFRRVRWIESKTIEDFFNPIRLVALFMTDTQLVICDVKIDSLDGDLNEEIQRISLPKIVNIVYESTRERVQLNVDDIVRAAEDLGQTTEQLKELRFKLDNKDADTLAAWVVEDLRSMLTVTRTDGGSLRVPIRSQRMIGQHKSALDSDATLSPDEMTTDRMINELNRLVDR